MDEESIMSYLDPITEEVKYRFERTKNWNVGSLKETEMDQIEDHQRGQEPETKDGKNESLDSIDTRKWKIRGSSPSEITNSREDSYGVFSSMEEEDLVGQTTVSNQELITEKVSKLKFIKGGGRIRKIGLLGPFDLKFKK